MVMMSCYTFGRVRIVMYFFLYTRLTNASAAANTAWFVCNENATIKNYIDIQFIIGEWVRCNGGVAHAIALN